jgi:hypothetical protein
MTCGGEFEKNVHALLDEIAQEMYKRNYCICSAKEKRLIISEYSKRQERKDVKA